MRFRWRRDAFDDACALMLALRAQLTRFFFMFTRRYAMADKATHDTAIIAPCMPRYGLRYLRRVIQALYITRAAHALCYDADVCCYARIMTRSAALIT